MLGIMKRDLNAEQEEVMRTIVVPGLGGSDEHHWQSLWERESPEMLRIAPASWDEPDFDDWADALERAAGDEQVVLVAHSLGCLLAVRWTRTHPDRVAGLFLVAAPDPAAPGFPAHVSSFTDDLGSPPGAPTILIASDNDPYCSPEQSAAFAGDWNAALIMVGPRGHLNSLSSLGPWAEGRNLLTDFMSRATID